VHALLYDLFHYPKYIKVCHAYVEENQDMFKIFTRQITKIAGTP